MQSCIWLRHTTDKRGVTMGRGEVNVHGDAAAIADVGRAQFHGKRIVQHSTARGSTTLRVGGGACYRGRSGHTARSGARLWRQLLRQTQRQVGVAELADPV